MISLSNSPFSFTKSLNISRSEISKVELLFKENNSNHNYFEIKLINDNGESIRHLYWGIDKKIINSLDELEDKKKGWKAYLNFLERISDDIFSIHHSFFHVIKEDLKKARNIKSLNDAKVEDLEKIVEFYEEVISNESGYIFKEELNFFELFNKLLNTQSANSIVLREYCLSKITNIEQGSFVLCSRHPVEGESKAFFDGRVDSNQISNLWDWLISIEKEKKVALRLRYFYDGDSIVLEELEELTLSVEGQLEFIRDMVDQELIDKKEGFSRISSEFFNGILLSKLDPRLRSSSILRSLSGSPGAASGKLCFSSQELENTTTNGSSGILVLQNAFFKNLEVLKKASAVICSKGGLTSHLAILCRGLGIPCLVSVDFSLTDSKIVLGSRSLEEGSYISIDGDSGEVFLGEIPLIPSKLKPQVKEILKWSDEYRDRLLLINADTPIELMGTDKVEFDGVGLCRTEHLLFLPERLSIIQKVIYEESKEKRKKYLEDLFPYLKNDFQGFFQQLQNRGVSIRLFDTDFENLIVNERNVNEFSKKTGILKEEILKKNEVFLEKNTSFGLRGSRLAIIYPEIYEMLIKAIFEAAINMSLYGMKFDLGILIPLISHENEFKVVKNMINKVSLNAFDEMGHEIDFQLGIILETPRSCLSADLFANEVDYMTFGTNDLTQMTLGMSRDDTAHILKKYEDQKIITENPFIELDENGVGELIKMAIKKAKSKNPNLRFLVCGEHVHNYNSLEFFYSLGIDAFSSSIYSIPYVKVVLAKLAIESKQI